MADFPAHPDAVTPEWLGECLQLDGTRVSAIRNHDRRGEYLVHVNREHEEIYAAIARRDPDSARAAMRIHLTNSRERLRLAQEAAQRAAGTASPAA